MTDPPTSGPTLSPTSGPPTTPPPTSDVTTPPTAAPVGGLEVEATPFCVDYTTQGGTPSEADLLAAAQVTCQHIQDYLTMIFLLNDGVDLTGTTCADTSSGPGPPPSICFDVSIFVSPTSEFTPSTENVDILIIVALSVPTVDELINDLGEQLPASNPLSTTTGVTINGNPAAALRIAEILSGVASSGDGSSTVLASSFVMFVAVMGFVFKRSRDAKSRGSASDDETVTSEHDVEPFLVASPQWTPSHNSFSTGSPVDPLAGYKDIL
jgi:hypothetical protein